MSQESDNQLRRWNSRQALAESMIPMIGTLYRDHGVVTSIYGRRLINQSAIEVLKAHRYARKIDELELPIEETLPVVQAMMQLQLGPASIDLAKLVARYKAHGQGQDLTDFLRSELGPVIGGSQEPNGDTVDVVLYGFGRIGRLLARILISHAGQGHGLKLRAIVVRKGAENDLVKRASLLRRDSVHGPFEGTITVDEENSTILANGTLIHVIYSNDPASIDYTEYGINNAIVVDNTGRWRDEKGLSQHLACPGVARVLLTAPGKGDLKNIVYGINNNTIGDDTILSAASCTTNAIVPVLKAVNDKYGIVHGHVETVHSYTNDQNLTDNFHAGDRRGRSAGLNMVLTETGAAKAVAKALPELEGKLSGNAIRVPVPNVSMAILNLSLNEGTTKAEVNSYLRNLSLDSPLQQQIDYIDSPEVVSSDFVGSHRAGIVDGLATISDDKNLVLYIWYDNEYGYSSQVVRVLEEMAASHPPVFPERASVAN
ncbi:glyceraldehyde-3-phosphate dehydrogenase [Homoserinimonas sp. OAct 916]|uniref:glyceraldehyde-3-phosphate dehydrogenase n=1 Tax=Homoserinimonas sp. OAct 916 TaxID=2211450 RepID=UPI000DBE2406|nr:glyceraldehyde-3-phosphate dehydrogenase [Homoserinimonas sp. OAct 916]